MLGRLRMSTEEALREYDHCAAKVFSFRNKKWTTATEKFRATALREVVQDLVRRRNMGDEMGVMTTPDNKGHCFVCAMPANRVGEPRRLRSFSVDTCDDPELGIKIWEAARATTAASFFFKPMPLRVSAHVTEDYIDAAIGCNNPVEYLLQEAADFIGTGRRLGCVISIGTGTRQVKIGRASTGCLNLLQAPKFLKELIGTLKNTATDGEETHRRVQAKFAAYPNAYFRFNVPDAAAKVKLHHYLKINILKAATMSYLSQPRVAAEILTAASVLERSSSDHGLTLGHLREDQAAPLLFSNPYTDGPEKTASTKTRSCCQHKKCSHWAIPPGFSQDGPTYWKRWIAASLSATLEAYLGGNSSCMAWPGWAKLNLPSRQPTTSRKGMSLPSPGRARF